MNQFHNMKTYLLDIIPKIKNYSKKLDDTTLLMDKHWVVIDEITDSKDLYIFRSNHELLVSKNGEVKKAKWEYVGNDALLIDIEKKSYLFKHGFIDSDLLALKLDGKNEYAILINEPMYEDILKTLEDIEGYLTRKYLTNQDEKIIDNSINQKKEEANESLDDIESEKLFTTTEKVVFITVLFIVLILVIKSLNES